MPRDTHVRVPVLSYERDIISTNQEKCLQSATISFGTRLSFFRSLCIAECVSLCLGPFSLSIAPFYVGWWWAVRTHIYSKLHAFLYRRGLHGSALFVPGSFNNGSLTNLLPAKRTTISPETNTSPAQFLNLPPLNISGQALFYIRRLSSRLW